MFLLYSPQRSACGLFLCPATTAVAIRYHPPATRFTPHAKITGFSVALENSRTFAVLEKAWWR
jgi:hypothetical protein